MIKKLMLVCGVIICLVFAVACKSEAELAEENVTATGTMETVEITMIVETAETVEITMIVETTETTETTDSAETENIALDTSLFITTELLMPSKSTEVLSPFVINGFTFTEENFPRIDGSTATIPLIEAVTSLLLGKPRWTIETLVSKTSSAYHSLSSEHADILFVYDVGDETRRSINADEIFETVPIGRDALVFLVNRDNPLDNLTTEQVQKIFTGEYTNWSELSGSDEIIRAYQRDDGSGSQALMDKLVMPGLEMADPASIPVISGMGGLVEAVADYSGAPSGIGYNVYFYVTEMRGNDYIKILSIDGVMPSYDTILSGEYPHISEFYSIIRKSEPDDSPARILHEWIQSEEGQNLIASENYVALRANFDAETPNMHGKFSPYPPGEEPMYFNGVDLFSLVAREDYGQLYFYKGTQYWGLNPNYDFGQTVLYGLCTIDGKIVTEPIYTVPLILTDSMGNCAYICFRSDKEPIIETIIRTDAYNDQIHSVHNRYPVVVFAIDGSWVLEFDGAALYNSEWGPSNGAKNNDTLAVMINGKWGAVNMLGELVIDFVKNSSDEIYEQSNRSSNQHTVTGNRYIQYIDGLEIAFLYNKEDKLIATDIRGRESGMATDYFVTFERMENADASSGMTVYTYTLDGELIASLSSTQELPIGYATLRGSYVWIDYQDTSYVCDRELNILCILLNEQNSFNWSYMNYDLGLNVFFWTDKENHLHRTYLMDGTRLVSWFDPEL